MAEHVSFDYSLAKGVIGQDELTSMKAAVLAARDTLENKKGAGNDFLGWIDLPEDYDKEEFARIQKAAEKIQSDSEVLVVIGIGGSYLGARAAIEFLRHQNQCRGDWWSQLYLCNKGWQSCNTKI